MTLNALREAALTGRSPEDKILAIFEYMEQIAELPDFYGWRKESKIGNQKAEYHQNNIENFFYHSIKKTEWFVFN